jgi:glycoside hydrolase family 31
MYQLGKQFIVNTDKIMADDKAVVFGDKYRFSVLSDRVIRLEYSEEGKFVDKPTQLIRRRNLGYADFNFREDQYVLQIETRRFALSYVKNRPFEGSKLDPMKNLKITLLSNDSDRNKDWYYGHAEARNLGGNIISGDILNPKGTSKGLYSLDGFASIDDSNSKIINDDGTISDPPAGHIDIYVFMYDKDFRQALFDYFKMTGAPALIPRYVLGNWWSRNYTYDDNNIKDLLRHFEKDRIPISVILLDHDWHIRDIDTYTKLKSGFTFNTNLFSDPKNMIDEFHKRGIRVGLITDPKDGFYNHEAFYKQAAEVLGVSDASKLPFNVLDPKTLDIYLKMFLHPLEMLGVDFFWNDYKDDSLLKLWSMQHYLFMDSGRDDKKRPVLLSRSSLCGAHRYSILYGGSSTITWDDLRNLPLKYLDAANIGVSWWSFDVAGNHGGRENSLLYLRNIQLGVFSPILRFHGARGKYYKKEPWLWDVKTEQIASTYLRMRHRLIPYIYTEAYNYTRSGTPLIQPFYYNYMWVYDDEVYRNQYYFGSQLLVCPIIDDKDDTMNRTIHRFFLPEGIWYDFITGKKFPGNKKYVSFFKDEDYPVFAHAGSIVPMSNKSDYNNTALPTELEIQVFPGISNTYTLYEDDGVTQLYKDGYFLKTSIDYNYTLDNYSLIVRSVDGKSGIVPEFRNYKIVFRNNKTPKDVVVFFDNNKIDFNSYQDGNDFVVVVEGVKTIGQLSVSCKGTDVEIEAARLINDEVNSVLLDLDIDTYLKEDIAEVMFSDLPINKKRIAVKKLKSKGLDKNYIQLFLKLLEYLREA